MLAAAFVEAWRLRLFREGRTIHEETAQQLQHASSVVDMSVFWQTGQYLLVGLSEVRLWNGQSLHAALLNFA